MNLKALRFLLLFSVLLLACLSLGACGHEHVESGWIMNPAATCTSVGHRYKKCNGCDEILVEEDYNTAHSYENGFCIYCQKPQNDELRLRYARITVDGLEGYAVIGIGSCNAVDMVIPEKYNSLPVLAIGDDALSKAVRIESITFPKTLRRIGTRAFYNCQKLKTVRFAAGSACTEIGDFAFAECENLRNAEIPSGVTSLGYALFSGCTKLKNLTLHDALVEIGEDALGGCTELVTHKENGLIYLGTATNPYLILMDVENRDTTAVTLHAQTRIVGNGALAGCTKLTAVTLPEELVSISSYAFSGCIALETVNLPATVLTVGNYAFQDCKALAALPLPASLLRIGTGAFSGCAALTTLTLPAGLTSVGAIAFYGCTSLQFSTHGAGKYLGTADNPYFLLCGYATAGATDAPHADNRVIADNAGDTVIP